MIAAPTRDRVMLALLTLLIVGSALGQRLPWHIDEVRFVGVALEMLQRGDWWVPHRAGEIYPDKPPVFFWILAGLIKLTDSVRWSFQLPGLISALFTTQLIYDLGTRLWNRRVGLCAGILLLCTYQFWRLCSFAHIDGLLVVWTTLGLYGLMRHMLSGRDQGWFYLGFAAIAAGILSKGVGFLPLLLFFPYVYLHWRGAALARIPRRQWLLGWSVLIAALLCWVLPLLWQAYRGDAEIHSYLNNILLRQTAGRYTHAWQHREPAWFFLAAIPKYWAPLSLLLPWLLPIWWRRLKRADPRYVLPLMWAALVVLFFSLSSGKRELYMFPALPAVALAAAPAVLLLLRQRWLRRCIIVLSGLLIVALAAAGLIAVTQWLPHSPLGMWPASAGFTLLGVAAIGAVGAVLLHRKISAPIFFLGVYCLTIVTYHQQLMPLLNARESERDLLAAVNAEAAPAPLAMVQWDEHFWLWSRLPLAHNGIRSDAASALCAAATWSRQNPDSRWLMSLPVAEQLGIANNAPQLRMQSSKDVWTVIRADGASHCTGAATMPRYQFAWSELSRYRLQR